MLVGNSKNVGIFADSSLSINWWEANEGKNEIGGASFAYRAGIKKQLKLYDQAAFKKIAADVLTQKSSDSALKDKITFQSIADVKEMRPGPEAFTGPTKVSVFLLTKTE